MKESRRSTRVPLKVVITIEGAEKSSTCEAETIVVSLHGALIATATQLQMGMKISIYVYVYVLACRFSNGKLWFPTLTYKEFHPSLHLGLHTLGGISYTSFCHLYSPFLDPGGPLQ